MYFVNIRCLVPNGRLSVGNSVLNRYYRKVLSFCMNRLLVLSYWMVGVSARLLKARRSNLLFFIEVEEL